MTHSGVRATHGDMAAVRTKSLRVGSPVHRRRVTDREPADVIRLRKLEAKVTRVLAAVEDELDYRLADARWQNHLKNKTRLYTPEEAKRELGLSA